MLPSASLFGTALGLSAGAGLNAYAVLLVYGAAARSFPEEFPGALCQWICRPVPMTVLAALFVLEFFVDKIRGLDRAWDVLQAVARPASGAFLAAAVVSPVAEPVLTVVAAGLGVVVALAAHFVKGVARLTSTALTAGVANVALSLAEDVLAFLQALVSLFLPTVAFWVVLALGVVFLATVPKAARSIDLLGLRRPGGPPTHPPSS